MHEDGEGRYTQDLKHYPGSVVRSLSASRIRHPETLSEEDHHNGNVCHEDESGGKVAVYHWVDVRVVGVSVEGTECIV